jgi:hypothetical protein
MIWNDIFHINQRTGKGTDPVYHSNFQAPCDYFYGELAVLEISQIEHKSRQRNCDLVDSVLEHNHDVAQY